MRLKKQIALPLEKDFTGWYKKAIIGEYAVIDTITKEGIYITTNTEHPMWDFRINFVLRIFRK